MGRANFQKPADPIHIFFLEKRTILSLVVPGFQKGPAVDIKRMNFQSLDIQFSQTGGREKALLLIPPPVNPG